jgi:hypothetical protein
MEALSFLFDCLIYMSFHIYNLKQLKQILRDFKEHHNIRNYHKRKKSDILKEIENHFQIDGGYLYALKGGSQNSAYVAKLEAKKEITNESFKKIKKPSKWLINKYGDHHVEHDNHPALEFHHEPAPHDAHDLPLFTEHETLDFSVGKDKPKKPKKKSKVHMPTEAEEERQEQERIKEIERKKKLVNELELKKCKNKLGKENNNYHKLLEELKHKKGMTKLKKSRSSGRNNCRTFV